MSTTTKKSFQDYQIAWIAALPIERSAATEMLDEMHEEPDDFRRNATDQNSYDWGSIHSHNIVITSLPTAIYGKANAAHTVTELLASLPHIKFGLLVGIGAGLPSPQHDIRLGDVVVSQPEGDHGGVIQYDLGKSLADGTWERKGFLQPPPILLLKALSNLQAKHESGNFRLTGFLSKAMQRNKYWAARYGFPIDKADRLLRSKRIADDEGFKVYTRDGELLRPARSSSDPVIHFGTIASGDTLVKNAILRDEIPSKVKQSCLCIEMEAAGLLSKFPCMVIRGICDYADSIKNDDWQRYASATAAAFAKELLLYVPVAEVNRSQDATGLMGLRMAMQKLEHEIRTAAQHSHDDKVANKITSLKIELLKALDTCPYLDQRKDRNIVALDGTCQWFLKHDRFVDFLSNPAAAVLWVSADPGCGKSVLAKHLVDQVLNVNKDRTICYFFFKDDFADQKTSAAAMRAILRQFLLQNPNLEHTPLLERFEKEGSGSLSSFPQVWDEFLHLSLQLCGSEIICLFDALDECQADDRYNLIKTICDWHQTRPRAGVKVLFTSRPYGSIKDAFYWLLQKHPTIHLSGESDAEREQISQEIDIVIRHRIHTLRLTRSLTQQEEEYLIDKVAGIEHRTYLWAHLTMDLIESTPGLTKGSVTKVLDKLPQSVNEAYEKILKRSLDPDKTRLLLQIILVARRPLSVSEVSLVLNLAEDQTISALRDLVEPPDRFKRTVRDLCGLFVIVVDGHVYFLHQTAREFLERRGDSQSIASGIWMASISISNSHESLTRRCLWFLFLPYAPVFHREFFEYCNQSWPHHFARTPAFDVHSPETISASHILDFWHNVFESARKVKRAAHRVPSDWNPDGQTYNSLGLAAWFDLVAVLNLMLGTQNQTPEAISSAFWWSVSGGNLSIAKILLASGANANTNRHGAQWVKGTDFDPTPLVLAISLQRIDFVQLLLENGADPNSGLWHSKQAPLTLAIFRMSRSSGEGLMQSVKLIEMLMVRGARVLTGIEDPLRLFLNHDGKACPSSEMIRRVAAVLQQSSLFNNDCPYIEPQFLLDSQHCHICLTKFIELGALADATDRFGNNSLHLMSDCNCYVSEKEYLPGRFEVLIHAGLDINHQNNRGWTPLMSASFWSNSKQVTMLLQYGALTEMVDREGKTAILLAIKSHDALDPHQGPNFCPSMGHHQEVAVLKTLLHYGANLSAQDVYGRTAVHMAVEYGDLLGLKFLLEVGADANCRNRIGQTPLMLSRPMCDREYAGARERAYGHRHDLWVHGRTQLDIVRLLLTNFASTDAVDAEGLTALGHMSRRLNLLKRPSDEACLEHFHIACDNCAFMKQWLRECIKLLESPDQISQGQGGTTAEVSTV